MIRDIEGSARDKLCDAACKAWYVDFFFKANWRPSWPPFLMTAGAPSCVIGWKGLALSTVNQFASEEDRPA